MNILYMHLDSKKILALLMVLAIALLPLRFGHAAEDDAVAADPSYMSHMDRGDCGDGGQEGWSHDCCEHSTWGISVGDCCGDPCSGVQFFMASAFELNFPTSRIFRTALLRFLPEPLVSVEFRPPIAVS